MNGVRHEKDVFSPEVTQRNALDMQVCVPYWWTDEQIIAFAEGEYPSGTSGWAIRKKGDPALAGDPERNPCSSRDEFVHVMLDA